MADPSKKVFTRETLEQAEARLARERATLRKMTTPAPLVPEEGWVTHPITNILQYHGRNPYLTARLVAAHIKDKAVRNEVRRMQSFHSAISASGEDPRELETRCRFSLKQLGEQIINGRKGNFEATIGYLGARDPFALAHLYLTWVKPVLGKVNVTQAQEFWDQLRIVSQKREYTPEFDAICNTIIGLTVGDQVARPLWPVLMVFFKFNGLSQPRRGDPPIKQRITEQTARLLSWVRTKYQEDGKLNLLTQTLKMFEDLPAPEAEKEYVQSKKNENPAKPEILKLP